ncbi:MAG: recombinase family protein, partial [Acidobacteria bacterium]|nr:recombinase family protein [Acidobacteriota bacterium]
MTTTQASDQQEHVIHARDYLRVSLDRSGRARSLEEQHADHERTAAEHGWCLGEDSYRDASISASRYSRKVRDDFDRLIADLEADRFGAQMLMLWESSRGSRRVGEWVNLLELCERHGVRIHVYTHNRTYDPANGRDRRSLLEDAVDGEYESSKMSSR